MSFEWSGSKEKGRVSNKPTPPNKPSGEYIYKPLAQGEIRLLRLERQEPGNALEKCSIFHICLSEAPEYTAMSYTWGDATNKLPIACDQDGKTLQITRNCHSMISRLSHFPERRVVWIDAICIDQEDIVEVNAQVAMMREIYQRATRVCVDLGDSAEDSSLAIKSLDDFDWADEDPPWIRKNGRLMRDIPLLTKKQRDAIEALLSRPWFSRVWVIQEAHLARNLELLCGLDTTRWIELWDWLWRRQFDRFEKGHQHPAILILTAPWNHQIPQKYTQVGGLLDLLHLTRPSHATDPRDKFFALLGILKDREAAGLSTDYTKSTREVFTSLAEFLLKTNGTRVLASVQGNSEIARLPTWVPDWSVLPSTMECRNTSLGKDSGEHWGHYRAGGDAKLGFYNISRTLSEDASTLKVRGWYVDTLTAIFVNKFDDHNSYDDQVKRFYNTIDGQFGKPNSWAPVSVWRNIWYTCCGVDSEIVYGSSEIIEDQRGQPIVTSELKRRMLSHLKNRALCQGERSTLAITPIDIQVSDVICVILGCPVPLAMRRHGDRWKMVGSCYVHDLMDGSLTDKITDRVAGKIHDDTPPEGLRDFLIE